MAKPSDCMDALTSDIRQMKTLIEVVTSMALNICSPDKTQCEETKREVSEVCDLLWIARDMVETITSNSDAVHTKVQAEKNRLRKGGAA